MRIILALAAASFLAFGATPVARVVGDQPIDVDGITAPARNFVPVSLGGQISTSHGTAVVQFTDGTSVTLQPNTQLRIEGQPGSPSLRVVRGSAQYKLGQGSRVRMGGSKGETLNKVLDDAILGANVATAPNGPVAQAVMYRADANRSGILLPSSPVSSGNFAPGSGSGSTFGKFSLSAAGDGSGRVCGPTGTCYTISNVTQSIVNGQVVYTGTISGATQSVLQPNGTYIEIPVTLPADLAGASMGVGITGTGSDTLSITPAGSSTPLNSNQLNLLQNAVQNNVNTAYNNAVNNGTIAPNSTPPTVSPISTGTFSGSAP